MLQVNPKKRISAEKVLAYCHKNGKTQLNLQIED